MQAPVERTPLQGHLGCVVRDELTGRDGVLMDVMPYRELSHLPEFAHLRHVPWVVFLRPPGGGREWPTVPEAVTLR